eukprot:TRINITY_DN22984_c0_g1_i1.p1 TRINITY_DN22984_c0_g1~~TRINITY_DN22984_c0_g1_i1.p1  ORF type:complete len:580 (+),score=100.99 TRINITY_DN22984_c0_g1_i1:60-1799(+)
MLEHIRQVHCKWDVDNDGIISENDLARTLAEMGMTNEAIHAVFTHMNEEATGSGIGYDNFVTWLTCRAAPQEALVQECSCSDGHAFDAFLPAVDGWCCEECGADLDVGVLALQCKECSGLSFCVECSMQQCDAEAVERIAIAAASSIHSTNEVDLSTDGFTADESPCDGDEVEEIQPEDEVKSECPKEGPIHLSISLLSGDTFTVDADFSWSVLELKSAIESKVGTPDHAFSLICKFAALQDAAVLASVLVSSETEIMLIHRSQEQVEWLQSMQEIRSRFEKTPYNVPSLLKSAPAEICDDRLIVLEAVSLNALDLQYASSALKADRGVVSAAALKCPMALQYASPELLSDFDFGLELVNSCGLLLEILADNLRSNVTIVLAAVSQNGMALRHVPDDLLENREVLDTAFARGCCLRKLQFSPCRLNDRIDVVRAAARRDRTSIKYASQRLRSDRDAIMWLLMDDPWHLQWVPQEMLADKQLLDIAFDANFSLRNAPERLRAHPEVVLRAVQQNGAELMYATQKLKSSRKIVTAAVRSNGMSLQHAAFHLRNDKVIVDLAAQRDSRAMQFAGANLKQARS